EFARSAASEIEKEGCSVKVDVTPQPWWQRLFSKPVWVCYASKSMVPERKIMFEISARFEEIAHRFSGEYDGWGTEVTK
ncbi:MAG: ribonuclease E inhibitor RraB, partial [Planctomycetota bacterium]